jgi:hypothetical protein
MESGDKFDTSEVEKFFKKYELKRIHTDVVERVITLVIAALGLIAALAWDDALKNIFEQIFGGAGTILEEVSYAIVITVIAALISVWLGKLFLKHKDKDLE